MPAADITSVANTAAKPRNWATFDPRGAAREKSGCRGLLT